MKKLAKSIAAKIRRDCPSLTYQQSKDLFKQVRTELNLQPQRTRRGSTVKRLSKSDLDRFLDAAYAHDAKTGIMLQVLYESACRIAEFCALEISDFYADECRLIIKEGKGGKRREIPITPALSRQIQTYLQLHQRTEGRIFQSQNSPWYTPRRMQQVVKAIGKTAAIVMPVTPHILRHTRLTLLAEAGMPKDHLQIFAGHTKPETTEIYTHTARLDLTKSFNEATQ